jgi:hypothetical protein
MTDEKRDTSPRKRSKISRACDSCRRKKVRCDGEFSTSDSRVLKPCTNCEKNHSECAFLRVPMKRGPLKGYIRDLEERLEHARPRKQSSGTNGAAGAAFMLPASESSTLSDTDAAKAGGLGSPTAPQNGRAKGSSGSLAPEAAAPRFGVSASPVGPLPFMHHSRHNSSLPPPIVPHLAPLPPMGGSPATPTGQPGPHSGPTGPIVLPPLAAFGAFGAYGAHSALPSMAGVPSLARPAGSPAPQPPFGPAQPVPSMGNKSPPIQGPFWKVPYEMPSVSDRRSSVESISLAASAVSDGSLRLLRSRLPVRTASGDTALSDSDDDYYLVNSFSHSSQSVSPRASVSLLSSLNGRLSGVKVQLHAPHDEQFPPAPPPPPPQGQSQAFFASQPKVPTFQFGALPYQPKHSPGWGGLGFPSAHSSHSSLSSHPGLLEQLQRGWEEQRELKERARERERERELQWQGRTQPALALLREGLDAYYQHFHATLALLPSQPHLEQLLATLPATATPFVELLNVALHNLVHFRRTALGDYVRVLTELVALYPFDLRSEALVVVFFLALMLTNYAVVMRGEFHLVGLSVVSGMLSDLRVLEGAAAAPSLGAHLLDLLVVFLPRVYVAAVLLLVVHALGFATQRSVSPLERGLLAQPDLALWAASPCLGVVPLLVELLALRDAPLRELRRHVAQRLDAAAQRGGAAAALSVWAFLELTRCKLAVLDYLDEIALDSNLDGEALHDHHLKLCRIVKGLASAIAQVAANVQGAPVASPLTGLAVCQLYKLIKLSKMITDSVTRTTNDCDLLTRCVKIHNDLLGSYSLLNASLCSPLPVLGPVALVMCRSRLEQFQLDFSAPVAKTAARGVQAWRAEHALVTQFVDREAVEGWY